MKFILFISACLFSIALYAQPEVLPAKEILAKAYKQAAKENKNVILIFHASWCGWCKKMDASMKDDKCKKYFEDNYVTVHLTVEESKENKNLENPGAAEIKTKYLGDKAGLPFWVILNLRFEKRAPKTTAIPRATVASNPTLVCSSITTILA